MMNQSIIAVFILILITVTSCSPFMVSSATEGKISIVSVALDYSDTWVSDLQGTVNDASEVALCLSEIYSLRGCENVIHLMIQDENSNVNNPDFPTCKNVMDTVCNLQMDSEDLLVFYFSGHGDKDTNGVFLATASDENEDYTKLYIDDLLTVLSKKDCKCVLILDCCYAGNATDYSSEQRDFEKAISELFKREIDLNNVAVLASSQADRKSLTSSVTTDDGDFENHSLFTSVLLKALGWEHSKIHVSLINGRIVHGYLKEKPQPVSVEKLYNKMSVIWSHSTQIPSINRTQIPVLIIS